MADIVYKFTAVKSSLPLLVLVLSMPSGVYPGKIPPIPAGHRAQYYLQRPDGGYSSGYDTGIGQTAIQEADARNEVRGEYAGGPLRVEYTAGVAGYLPTVQVQTPATPIYAPPPPLPAQFPPTPPPPPPPRTGFPHPTFPFQTTNAQVLRNPDGSYAFSYQTLDQSRVASGNAQNNVRDSFSFVTPSDGVSRRVDYNAGAGTGRFVAQGAHLPIPPQDSVILPAFPPPPPRTGGNANAQGLRNQDGSYAFAYQTADQSRVESADAQNNVQGSFSFVAPDDSVNRRVDYKAGAQTGFVAQGAHLPTTPQPGVTDQTPTTTTPFPRPQGLLPRAGGEQANTQVSRNGDGSYAFAYQTADQSRQESADSKNNVQGSFAFVAPDDGVVRRVDYRAGAQTGFVAQGAHLPTTPQPGVTDQTPTTTPPLPRPDGLLPRAGGEQANTQVNRNGDGSYAFAYQTADQSRQESADSKNNVQGSFSFVAPDDGVVRRVDYKAGARTGFVAQGAHLPSTPQPGVTEQTPTETETDSTDSDYDMTTPPSDEGSDKGSDKGSSDASYAFVYQTPNQERAESSDRAGNVRGYYSFVAPDGVRRRVDIEAGAGKGVIASGDHLPTSPSVPKGYNALQNNQVSGAVPLTPAPVTYSGYNTGSWFQTYPYPGYNPGSWPKTYPNQRYNTGSWSKTYPDQRYNTGSWFKTYPDSRYNTGSWSKTYPDPLRVDTNLGNLVARTYLPSHPVKSGYVLDVE